MIDLRKKIVMIASAVVVGISLIFTFVNYQNYSAKVDENRKQYHDLKSEYEDATKNQKTVSEDDVKNGLNSAKKSGDDVANLLNQYLCALPYAGTNFTEEQAKEKASEREEMTKQLNAYFGEGTVMSTGVYSFDMSLIGNQSCWQFMNSYNFSGDSIDVLWECSDNDGNVVAYVTAQYHAENNSFDNVSSHMTTLGQTYMSMTGNDNASEKIDTTDTTTIFDVMQNAGISEETRKELEDYHNDKEAMEAQESNEAARDALKNSSKN